MTGWTLRSKRRHQDSTVRFVMPRLGILFLLALLAVCRGPIAQQNYSAKEPTPLAENLLSVHAEVLAQTYCHVDDQAFTASIELKLHFTNISGHAVILSRKIESPNIVRAARDAEEGKNGTFIYSPDPHFLVAKLPKSPSFQSAPDPKLFVILKPGESFDSVVYSGVLGAKSEATGGPTPGLLSKGNYVLQVGVETWPYDWPYFDAKVDPQELKHQWARYGELSTGLAYSDFVPLVIPEHFKNPRCK
jgi:hypothetical protein